MSDTPIRAELIDSPTEVAVLGGVLIAANMLSPIREVVSPEDFGDKARGYAFSAICRAHDKYQDAMSLPDVISEMTIMNESGVGKKWGSPIPDPQSYLTNVLHQSTGAIGLLSGAERIAGMSARKAIYDAGIEIANIAIYGKEFSVTKITEQAEAQLFKAASKRQDSDNVGLQDVSVFTERGAERLEIIRSGGLLKYFIPTGLKSVDKYLIGYQKGSLSLVVARPGKGKTALAIGSVLAAAKAGKRVGFFSLEMPGDQMTDRMISYESGIDAEKIRRAKFDNDEQYNLYYKTKAYIETLPIYIDDSSSVSPMALRRRCRRSYYQDEVDIIIIDYLQLMEPEDAGSNEAIKVDQVARALKIIARELNIPVVALGQLSRAVENRQDQRPQLSDIRYGGEQHADCVLGIHRPENKGGDALDAAPSLNMPPGYEKPCILILKNRNGPAGTALVRWIPALAKYIDVAFESGTLGEDAVVIGEPKQAEELAPAEAW